MYLCLCVCSRVLNGRRASFGGDLTSGSSLNTVTASRYTHTQCSMSTINQSLPSSAQLDRVNALWECMLAALLLVMQPSKRQSAFPCQQPARPLIK
jgi:hypothetical protein